MAHEILEKTPTEEISKEVDFTELLPSDTSLGAGSTVTATDSSGSAAAAVLASSSSSGLVLTAQLQAGTNGEDYLIRYKAVGGQTSKVREYLIEMRVRTKHIGSV